MNKNYSSNYFSIYFWQIIGFALRFLSMFIVLPYISKDKTIYGIYTVCISVTFFLNYADLGFLRAAQKYAAEYFSRDDREEEMRSIGFGGFVLMCFTLPFCLAMVYLGVSPQRLISGISSPLQISVASKLLFILAVFTPVSVIQRMSAIIFDIRLDGFVVQRVFIVSSLITIASVFYFFSGNNYQIVSYFFFLQFMSLLTVLVSLYLAKKKYGYCIATLFKHFRFSLIAYRKMKRLAFSSFYTMIFWIIFYEIDQMVIGKVWGAETVATYAISLVFATLFRTVYGIIFSPFTVRANHFVGSDDESGLRDYCFKVCALSAPLVVLPTIALAMVAEPFILSWVGRDYIVSIPLARCFALLFIPSFITYPASMLLISKERIKEMNVIATVQPVVFWLGIFMTYSYFGINSFAYFKFLAVSIGGVYYASILIRYFEISVGEFFKRVVLPLVVPVAIMILLLMVGEGYLPREKSKLNLLFTIGYTGFCILLAFTSQYFISVEHRKIFNGFVMAKFKKSVIVR